MNMLPEYVRYTIVLGKFKMIAVYLHIWISTQYVIILVCCVSVICPSLTDPSNGTVTCPLGDDGVPSYSYEDICSFTCNTGYELTGSDTRTCQSDRSWSGTETMCRRGTFTVCLLQSIYLSNCSIRVSWSYVFCFSVIFTLLEWDLYNENLCG